LRYEQLRIFLAFGICHKLLASVVDIPLFGIFRRSAVGFYFLKQMSFAQLFQEQLDHAVQLLNTRPRKRLGYKTPKQVFEAKW
jgi:hypothetical protein